MALNYWFQNNLSRHIQSMLRQEYLSLGVSKLLPNLVPGSGNCKSYASHIGSDVLWYTTKPEPQTQPERLSGRTAEPRAKQADRQVERGGDGQTEESFSLRSRGLLVEQNRFNLQQASDHIVVIVAVELHRPQLGSFRSFYGASIKEICSTSLPAASFCVYLSSLPTLSRLDCADVGKNASRKLDVHCGANVPICAHTILPLQST